MIQITANPGRRVVLVFKAQPFIPGMDPQTHQPMALLNNFVCSFRKQEGGIISVETPTPNGSMVWQLEADSLLMWAEPCEISIPSIIKG
jgi:hypothetical protein